jgi:hypothetical protein
MAFHIVAFTSTITTGTTLKQLTASVDGVVTPLANGLVVPGLNKVAMAMHVGTNATRYQLYAPSLRDYANFDGDPVQTGTVWASPLSCADMRMNPLTLQPGEELDAYVLHSDAGTQRQWVGVILSDGALQPIQRPSFSVHWTSTTTLVANAWTQVNPTLDQSLPYGNYAVIGARFYSATGLLARFLPVGGPLWRPGGIVNQTYVSLEAPGQRYGGFGQWLNFNSTAPPSMQYLASAADTAEEGVWDLVAL